MTMKLKQLSIRTPAYYEDDFKTGQLRGEIEMEGDKSKVSVKLTNDQCRQILAIVGQAARDTTDAAVQAMQAEVFNMPTTALIEE